MEKDPHALISSARESIDSTRRVLEQSRRRIAETEALIAQTQALLDKYHAMSEPLHERALGDSQGDHLLPAIIPYRESAWGDSFRPSVHLGDLSRQGSTLSFEDSPDLGD